MVHGANPNFHSKSEIMTPSNKAKSGEVVIFKKKLSNQKTNVACMWSVIFFITFVESYSG